jgi:hypothetical protein
LPQEGLQPIATLVRGDADSCLLLSCLTRKIDERNVAFVAVAIDRHSSTPLLSRVDRFTLSPSGPRHEAPETGPVGSVAAEKESDAVKARR